MQLTGKTAIVTGGSRGIGRAAALTLAEAGADVAVIYAGNTAAAEETVRLIEEKGRKGLAIQCDVADEAAVTAMVKDVKKELGRIDILVNNAGITRDGLLMIMKEADWQAVLDTNLTGAFHCTKAVTRLMMKQRSGSIINITSVVGELCCGESRPHRFHQIGCQRTGFAKHPLQCHCSGMHRNGYDGCPRRGHCRCHD